MQSRKRKTHIGKLIMLSSSFCRGQKDAESPLKTSPVQNTPAALLKPGKNSGLTFKTVSIRRPSTVGRSTIVDDKGCRSTHQNNSTLSSQSTNITFAQLWNLPS